MSFKKKYNIIPRYLTSHTKRRSGLAITPEVKFIVAHDTGNSGSTAAANVAHYENTNNDIYASAHIFVDDKEIIECIPALTSNRPEKAWHVRYNVTADNDMYGYEANDTAVGIEYCHGPNINADEAYKRYVWITAYTCFKFTLDPKSSIVGHFLLDPERRTDPVSGLRASGRTYEQFLQDVLVEYNNCSQVTYPLKLIKIQNSSKVYALGKDNKKHWIFNETSFNIGRVMGLWGDFSSIEVIGNDTYPEGHTLVFIK